MNKFKNKCKGSSKLWFIAFLFVAVFMSGCGVWKHTSGTNSNAPTVTFTVPATVVAPGVPTSGVAINSKMSATFSEAMNPATINTTTFILKQGTTRVSGTVAYSGVTAVFTPSSNLNPSTTYTATITTGAKDLAGNAMASNYVWSFSTAATADTTAPTVTLTDPATVVAPGVPTSGVPINQKISATFSEPMDPLTINTTTFTLKQGTTAVTGAVTYSGVIATFTPSNNLVSGTTYTATITTGATDLAGNALATNYVWSFSTAAALDTTPPAVIFTDPANGATGVAINKKIAATFSEGMDTLTITNLTFMLKGPGGTPITGTAVLGIPDNIATFTPNNVLAAGTTYTATITTGVKDLAGNAMVSNYVWNFSTAAALDTTPPTVTLVHPVNGATSVCINTTISATFSEGMDPLTISNLTFMVAGITGTVNYDATTNAATFTPTNNLAAGTTYTATITTGVKDLAGNAMASNYAWTFTTGTTTCAAPIDLGILSPYAIASAGGITNGGATKINGDAVLDPLATCNAVAVGSGNNYGLCGGFPPTNNAGDTVITNTFPDTTTADAVMAVLLSKWNSISEANMPGGILLGCGTIGSAGGAGVGIGCAGNFTLPPGIYVSASNSTIGVTGNLVLDGQGDQNAVWVFQAPSALTTAANSTITLINGAKASNVWWYVGSSATLLGGTIFNGNILASASISLGTGATSCGRLLSGASGAGAFTFLANTVSVPGNPNAPVNCN